MNDKAVRYKVNEQFDSVQGEGVLTGVPSTFIRLQGCSVGCPWCDSGPLADEIEGKRRTNGMTANTWGAGGEWKTLDEIVSAIGHKHVIITGGEPTIWNLDPILAACSALGYSTQLETSGQNALKGTLSPDWITWSPKERLQFEAPQGIKLAANEVKFVVDNTLRAEDVQKIADYYYYIHPNGHYIQFVFMPEGCPPSKVAIEKAMWIMNSKAVDFHGIRVRFGWRLQYTLNMR